MALCLLGTWTSCWVKVVKSPERHWTGKDHDPTFGPSLWVESMGLTMAEGGGVGLVT